VGDAAAATVMAEVVDVDLEEVARGGMEFHVLEQGADRSGEAPSLVLMVAASHFNE